MSDDRDTPRLGRPPDFPSATAPDDEHTPPPAPPPKPTPLARERIKAATMEPDLPSTARQAFLEIDRQMSQLRSVATDLAAAATAVHPLRKAGDDLVSLVTRVERLESRPDQILDEVDDLRERVTDISGRSGDNGKLGALTDRVDRVEVALGDHVKTTTTTFDDIKAFKWKAIGVITVGGILGGVVTAVITALIVRAI